MVSDKKLAANRANAQRSTGPRTPEGKSAASRNATTHGAYTQNALLPHEDPAQFQAEQNDWRNDLNPQTRPELACVDRAFALHRRLARLAATESHLYAEQQRRAAHRRAESRIDAARQPDHAAFAALRDLHLADAQTQRDPIAQAFADDENDNPFDRLYRTEQRLQNMLHRALSELRHLQKSRRAAEQDDDAPPCPYTQEQIEPTEDPDPIGDPPPTPPDLQIEPTNPPPFNNPPSIQRIEPTAPAPIDNPQSAIDNP